MSCRAGTSSTRLGVGPRTRCGRDAIEGARRPQRIGRHPGSRGDDGDVVSARMLRVLLTALLVSMILVGLPAATPAAEKAIWKVQVLRVNQQPYQPVAFRIAVHASVGDTIGVGYKIWDANKHGVYSPSTTDYTQPYQATSLTLHWGKRGYDGNPVPRAGYYVEAAAGDITSNGKLVWSAPVFFRLTS